MEMLLQLQPELEEPTTLVAALTALKLTQIRLSVTFNWIIRFHGKLPVSLREELQRAQPQPVAEEPNETLDTNSPGSDSDSDSSETEHEQFKTFDKRSRLISPKINFVKQEPDDDESPDEHICSHCGASFESAPALSVHSLVHAKLRLTRMGITQKNLVLRRRANRKMVVVKRSRASRTRKPKRDGDKTKIPCELCPKLLPTERALTYHMTSAHKLCKPCDECGVRFTTNKERTAHIRADHPELTRHKCDICERSFFTKEQLQHHVTQVHPDPDQATTCDVCGKFCKTRQNLKQHLQRNHVDPSLAVQCPTCGVKVKSAKLLKSHMHNHGPRSFLCQLCGYVGRTKTLLQRHINGVHSTVRAHKCEHCPLTFKDTNSLQDHVNRHFGKNLKPCPYCGIEKVTSDLSNHVNIVHKGRKFKCAHCPAMFSLRAHLKNHYKLKHLDVTIPADADLEVIYTKNPEDTTTPAPPTIKRSRTTHGTKTKARDGVLSGLVCSTCPGAVFKTRQDLDLHLLRHQKDPDYKFPHRMPVQRLDQPTTTQVASHPDPVQPQPHQQVSPNQFPPQACSSTNANRTQFPIQQGSSLNTPQYHPYNNPFMQPHVPQQGYTAFAAYAEAMLSDNQLISGHQHQHQGSRF